MDASGRIKIAKIVSLTYAHILRQVQAQTLRRSLIGIVILIAAVLWAYWPARSGGFVLDDDLLLTHNSLIKAPDGLYRFWFTKQALDYWPVSNTTLWLEWRLWGMNPTGYHVTNLLLHIANALLLWLVLRKLAIPGAWLAALLFVVHPVNVESVAWIAQRKNVLAMFFFLLSILWWLKEDDRRETQSKGRDLRERDTGSISFGIWYWLSLAAFILAMLSKGSVAILPIVLLLIVWWQWKRITWRDFLRAAPFLAVASVLTVVDMHFQAEGPGNAIRDVTALQRLLGAGAVIWFYLGKALVPLRLTFVYPQWDIQSAKFFWWLPLLASIAATILLVWKVKSVSSTWWRPAWFAWAFFMVALVPVMGFVDVGYMRHSLVADHYQYIAMIAVAVLAAAAICSGWKKLPEAVRPATGLAVTAVVVALTIMVRQQSSLYASALALYQNAVDNNPASGLAHNNLGDALTQANRPQEAIVEFEKTVELMPDSAKAHNNLAMRLADVGRLSDAIDHYQQALRLQPKHPDAENNYAMALATSGRLLEAQSHFEFVLECEPNFAEAHNNFGSLLLQMGQLEHAVAQFQLALKLKPDYLEAYNNLGIVLTKSGLFQEAIDHYQQALRVKPDSAETHNNLGNVLVKSGRLQEAISHYQEALSLKPDYEQAYVGLALAQSVAGDAAAAVPAAETALALARMHNQENLAAQIEAWLTAHRSSSTTR
ncbi:MAG TPA: tetratricopeptide repeat protein [Pirellulales bacterium]